MTHRTCDKSPWLQWRWLSCNVELWMMDFCLFKSLLSKNKPWDFRRCIFSVAPHRGCLSQPMLDKVFVICHQNNSCVHQCVSSLRMVYWKLLLFFLFLSVPKGGRAVRRTEWTTGVPATLPLHSRSHQARPLGLWGLQMESLGWNGAEGQSGEAQQVLWAQTSAFHDAHSVTLCVRAKSRGGRRTVTWASTRQSNRRTFAGF